MADLEKSTKSANEMLTVLSSATLIPSFEEIKYLYQKEDSIRGKNLQDAKAIILNLQDAYRCVEDKATGLGECEWSQDAFEENIRSRREAKAELEMQVEALKAEEQQREEKMKETQQKSILLEQKKKSIEKENLTTVLEEKSLFELYLQTTGIRWNYNCKPNEILGYASGNKNIKPFSLNSDEHDSYYATNYLWDVVEEVNKN